MKNNVINKDGKILVPSNLVMLPTDERSHIYRDTKLNKIGYVIGKYPEDLEQFPNQTNTQNQYLYFLSNEEIKKGDIGYNTHTEIIFKATIDFGKDELAKKVIASTDPSLNLPRPSDVFIRKFCEAGGIWKVLVEYKTDYAAHCITFDLNPEEADKVCREHSKQLDCEGCDLAKISPKVAPDNTISIYPVKNSWNREEVIQVLNDFMAAFPDGEPNGKHNSHLISNWIKEHI